MNTTVLHPGRHPLQTLTDAASRWARRREALVASDRVMRALSKGATYWVNRPRSRQVHCTCGTLWLTFDGHPQDVVLEAGEALTCAWSSRLAIHALTDAGFTLS